MRAARAHPLPLCPSCAFFWQGFRPQSKLQLLLLGDRAGGHPPPVRPLPSLCRPPARSRLCCWVTLASARARSCCASSPTLSRSTARARSGASPARGSPRRLLRPRRRVAPPPPPMPSHRAAAAPPPPPLFFSPRVFRAPSPSATACAPSLLSRLLPAFLQRELHVEAHHRRRQADQVPDLGHGVSARGKAPVSAPRLHGARSPHTRRPPRASPPHTRPQRARKVPLACAHVLPRRRRRHRRLRYYAGVVLCHAQELGQGAADAGPGEYCHRRVRQQGRPGGPAGA